MSEASETCPKCGMRQILSTPDGYRTYQCTSFSHVSGECFEQGPACTALAAAQERVRELEKENERMRRIMLCRTICRKCGQLGGARPHQKYCGDGSDKDNGHSYERMTHADFLAALKEPTDAQQ